MMIKKIAFLCTIILFSCTNKNATPSGILQPAKMQTIMWDVLQADAFTNDFIKKDTTKKPESENIKLQQQIFAVNKISKDDYYKSFEYYKTHPELMQTLLDSLIAIKTRDKFKNTVGQFKNRDTVR